MLMKSPNSLVTESQRARVHRSCPECNARMVEVDRCSENGVLFLWYECIRGSCKGQWLQKISR
jgi:hypothetical protein